MENRDNADCKSNTRKGREGTTICTIKIEKSVMIEYHFVDDGVFNMHPQKITVFTSTNVEDIWQIYKQFNYVDFEHLFQDDKSTVNRNLPIGYGCTRPKASTGTYPQIETNYGNSFAIDYEVVLNYFVTEVFSIIPMDIRKTLKSRTFFNRMYHDANSSLNVVESLNEFTDQPTRTIYNTKTRVGYDIMMDTDKCQAFHMNRVQPINYFYVQDLFINNPEFFHANHSYTYIGEQDVDDKTCLIFERSITGFDRQSAESRDDSPNQMYLDFIRMNLNGIRSDNAIVTHYYPKATDHWGAKAERFAVPIKIEIRLMDSATEEIAKLTINVASFKPLVDDQFERNEIYDLTKCVEHTPYDYDWFQVKFDHRPIDDRPTTVEQFDTYEAQIKSHFRMLFKLSALRLGEMMVDSDKYSIYITAQLFRLPGAEMNFHRENGLTIQKPTVQVYTENEQQCAGRCLGNKNCAAYSVCSNLICKLWIYSNFDSQFKPDAPSGEDFHWFKIRTREDDECSFSRRFVKYDEKLHRSNEEILNKLHSMIRGQKIEELVIMNKDFEPHFFAASDLKMNVQPGRRTEQTRWTEQRDHIKYNDLFQITHADRMISPNGATILSSSSGRSLSQCQFACTNKVDCRTMSYCRESGECVLSTLTDQTEIAYFSELNKNCSTSMSK